MVGWGCFSPVTSRVSPRQPSYFFLLRQKKVTKKKASHVRAASRSLALLAAFGTLANSLRSNNASVLIRTLLRCSARPNGGGIPLGSSASRTSPERLVRFALGLPHSSRITSHKGTARRATTTDPLASHSTPSFRGWEPKLRCLIPHASLGSHKGTARRATTTDSPHSSFHPVIPGVSAEPKLRHSARSRGIHVSLHSNLDAATTRSMTACAGHRCPHHPHHSPSFLIPHSYGLTPHSSQCGGGHICLARIRSIRALLPSVQPSRR